MKKINVLIISFLFLLTNNIQASLFQAPNPYSFGPQGRSVSDLKDFAKPKQMANILAGRPVVATKSDGSRVYYTSDGKMALSIKQNGEMTFSLGGHSKMMDKFGNLKMETKTLQGNFQEVKNEFGEIQSYNQLDGSNHVIATYDKDMNKTATFNYGEFGKTLKYSINEMTKQKTVYDEYERTMAVYSADGYILTTYQYGDVEYDTDTDRQTLITKKKEGAVENGAMVSSKAYYNKVLETNDKTGEVTYDLMAHNTTFYDDKGLALHIDNYEGLTTSEFFYKQDNNGNKVLEYVLDTTNKSKTYYENNRQQYVVDFEGHITTKYYWNGSKFLFSAQVGADGNWISTTNSDNITTFNNIVYNKDGTIDTVADEKGNIVERYFYKEDADGNSILDYVENALDGAKTYYDENGCSTQTVDVKGKVLTDYSWNKGNLVYSFDRESGITKWYNGDQEIVYESLNDRIMSKNIYVAGQLIGKWECVQGNTTENGVLKETTSYTLTLFVNEQQVYSIKDYSSEEPTESEIQKLVADFINGDLR